jgi:alkylation response protein AidB-like acyl-CoA dehydrogenase
MGEAGGAVTPDQMSTSLSGGVLNGTKVPVADGGIADVAIVVCTTDKGDGATLALVDLSQDCIDKDNVQMIDFSRGHAELIFNGACAEVLGEEGAGWAAVESLMNTAAILFAWEQIGIADRALEQAREYALGRFAFGRSIASYQAIKHKLAKMYVKNTLARSNAYYGAWALNAGASDLAGCGSDDTCGRRFKPRYLQPKKTFRPTVVWALPGNLTASFITDARNF